MFFNNATEVLNLIKRETSTNGKGKILAEAMKDVNSPLAVDLYLTLCMALSPRKRFGVILKEMPEEKMSEVKTTFSDALRYLEAVEWIRTDEQKAELNDLLSNVEDPAERQALVNLINKDLNIGIGTTIVNKVFKSMHLDPVAILNPMKAKKEKDIDMGVFMSKHGMVAVQTKVDAARAFMIGNLTTGESYFLTASGNRLDCFSHITNPMMLVVGSDEINYEAFVVDGEIVCLEEDGSMMERRKSNGLLNKAVAGSLSRDDALRFVFVAWDFNAASGSDPEGDLYGKEYIASPLPYIDLTSTENDRFYNLRRYVDIIDHDDSMLLSGAIQVVKNEICHSMSEVYAAAERAFADGEEGVIVKTLDHKYEAKRSSNLIKIKKAFMADVRVTGINEGKNKGTLGSLKYETDDSEIKGDVSGIPNNLKELWWNDPELIVNKVIETRYMEVTFDKRTGEKTLYGPPVFVRVRDDKHDTSLLEELS